MLYYENQLVFSKDCLLFRLFLMFYCWFPGRADFSWSQRMMMPVHQVPKPTPQQEANPPKYHCDRCGKLYRWKQSLNLHRRLECGVEPQFKCPHCPHRSKQKGSLTKHILNKHVDFSQRTSKSAVRMNFLPDTHQSN